MLVIRRRIGESILIGDEIELQITDISANRVKIGIVAPRAVLILRKEIQLAAEQNMAASQSLTIETMTELLSNFGSEHGRKQTG